MADRDVQRRRWRTLLGVAAALTAVASSVLDTAPSRADTRVPRQNTVTAPTDSSLELALHRALAIQVLPGGLHPSIAELDGNSAAYAGSSYEHANCDPYEYPSETSHPQPCWYGSKLSTAPVIVIFGDSFVGNWVPALDLIGRRLNFRIADFEFDSCVTPFVEMVAGRAVVPVSNVCKAWHRHLPSSVVPLHARAVIAASGSASWGTGDANWTAGLRIAFSMLNPKRSSVQILIGTGPHLANAAPACLSGFATKIQTCTYRYSPTGNYQHALARDATAAQTVGVHLIRTQPWICYGRSCPEVVGDIDVYVDTEHLSVAYSKFLNLVLQSSLAPLIDST